MSTDDFLATLPDTHVIPEPIQEAWDGLDVGHLVLWPKVSVVMLAQAIDNLASACVKTSAVSIALSKDDKEGAVKALSGLSEQVIRAQNAMRTAIEGLAITTKYGHFPKVHVDE